MRIDEGRIKALLEGAKARTTTAEAVIRKASLCKGLELDEAAVLLSIEDARLLQDLYRTASEVKERVFGKRIVLFAPLYLSNYCTNGCLYCGFRNANKGLSRKALRPVDVATEASALEAMGFKRVLLVTGEDKAHGLDYIIACVRAVYEKTGIRIVHVNAPPMDVDSLRELKKAGVGVYQSFQETYHRPTYEIMHPTGAKRDYQYRLDVMDRALEAGFDDVGIGALLGLYDHRFDCLAAISHSMHLYERFGAHAHTISIPRLRPATEAEVKDVPYPVPDEELKKIVAVYRLSVPSAGVVASTRESAELRSVLMRSGASQVSAASRTDPGGYTRGEKETLEQFSTSDRRTLSEVMASIAAEGLLPSLCTTCYRVGRVGHAFTEKTLSGEMDKFCQANAILTLKEYLIDHCRNGQREAFERALALSIEDVKDASMKEALLKKLKELEEGRRDLFF